MIFVTITIQSFIYYILTTIKILEYLKYYLVTYHDLLIKYVIIAKMINTLHKPLQTQRTYIFSIYNKKVKWTSWKYWKIVSLFTTSIMMSITKLYTVLCMERAYYHELMNTLECCYTLVIEILLTEMFVCIIIMLSFLFNIQ